MQELDLSDAKPGPPRNSGNRHLDSTDIAEICPSAQIWRSQVGSELDSFVFIRVDRPLTRTSDYKFF